MYGKTQVARPRHAEKDWQLSERLKTRRSARSCGSWRKRATSLIRLTEELLCTAPWTPGATWLRERRSSLLIASARGPWKSCWWGWWTTSCWSQNSCNDWPRRSPLERTRKYDSHRLLGGMDV